MLLNRSLLKEIRQSKLFLLLSIGFGLLAGLSSILQAGRISQLIDLVFLKGKVLQDVTGVISTVCIIILCRALFAWIGDFFSSAGTRRIKKDLRHRLFRHLINIGPAYLKNEAGETNVRTGELISVTTEGVDALDAYYSQYLPQIALAVLIPLTILIFVFPIDFLTGIILLVTAPLLPIFMYLIGNAAETLTHKQWQGLGRMSAYFLDVIQGLATLKSLGRSREQVALIQKVSDQYRHSTMSVLKVTFLSALVLELISTLSTAVVAVEIGLRLLYGKMAFEQAFFILLLAPEFYLPMRVLGSRFHAAMSGSEAGKRIFGILDLPISTDILDIKNLGNHHRVESSPPLITIKDVSYSYANQRTALQGISFDIPAGKITALRGESGAGKTSLSWLLLKFLHPQSGEIFVNDKRLSEIPAEQWWDQLAWVSQAPYLFNDTIAANIKLARPDATEADVQKAARLAHAEEFIDRLPQGYATLIGERGARLSIGQAQRIALARAFLKDAPLLILDEATAHLDPETDSLLRESLARLSRGRTILVIAHHQSTLSMADQVITLKQGRIEQIRQTDQHILPLHPEMQSMMAQASSQPDFEITGTCTVLKPLDSRQLRHPQPVLKRLINLLSPFTGRILLSIFLGFATVASGIGLMATSAYIISAAALHPSIAELQIAIVGVRFFGVTRGVFRYLERLVSHDVTFRLLARWRVRFYQALEPLAPARLMQYHSGDLLSRVIGDIGILEGFYVRAVAPPLVALMVAIVLGGFFSTFNPGFTLLLAVFLVLVGISLPILMSILSHQLGSQMIQAKSLLNQLIMDGIQGLPDLITCCQADAQIQRVNQASQDLTGLQARMSVLTSFQSAAVGLFANLCMLSVFVFAIQQTSQDQLAGVMLGVLALAALMSFEAVQPLPVAAQHLETNRAAARRLYELVDADPEINDPAESIPLPQNNHLTVKNLSFQYPAPVNEAAARNFLNLSLDKISFTLPEGKHVSIIGSNGAGKTTLINLLQRFWEYKHGSIQIGGSEFHQYHQEDIRSRIAALPQNPYLFSTTIRENLLVAWPNASAEDLIQVVKAAGLSDLIEKLPDGYNTWIGEHGLRLSAGERQRLAIARVLLRNSPLIILDEPTSNLDPATEATVLNSIRDMCLGRSMITITQHLVNLDMMDEILVLKDGQLVEHASHDQLLTKGGLYSQMWNLYNQLV